jgi:hypothetical protein
MGVILKNIQTKFKALNIFGLIITTMGNLNNMDIILNVKGNLVVDKKNGFKSINYINLDELNEVVKNKGKYDD